ncbi:MAG TPA: MBL fold metallo-hydrolase [Acidobacteriota bacterium]|nr:MBL fold metallo-hydrolase [Acidobacteriota bacterium]
MESDWQFRLTTLCDNCVPLGAGHIAEHGLAILVETPATHILFDTGQDRALLHNAEVLGKDLRRVRHVVLSHGHYDHTGGLPRLLELGFPFSLTAHPCVFEDKFVLPPGGTKRNIGSPVDQARLESHGMEVRLSEAPVRVTDHVTTTGEVPFRTDFETVGSGFYSGNCDQKSADEIPDDLSLVLETSLGLVVVLGCAHRGMINHLLQARAVTGRDEIYSVIGGAHLHGASDECIEKTIAELRRMNVRHLSLGHCTGFAAMAEIRAALRDRMCANTVGSVLAV